MTSSVINQSVSEFYKYYFTRLGMMIFAHKNYEN